MSIFDVQVQVIGPFKKDSEGKQNDLKIVNWVGWLIYHSSNFFFNLKLPRLYTIPTNPMLPTLLQFSLSRYASLKFCSFFTLVEVISVKLSIASSSFISCKGIIMILF